MRLIEPITINSQLRLRRLRRRKWKNQPLKATFSKETISRVALAQIDSAHSLRNNLSRVTLVHKTISFHQRLKRTLRQQVV